MTMFRFVDLQVLSERIAMVLSNSNSKSLRARSAPGMYSSLEGLRCLLNTWPFSKRKGSSITDMIYPNISSHISSHTLWHFSCFFRYPHFNQTTPTTPKTACGIFVRGIEKKKTAWSKRLRTQTAFRRPERPSGPMWIETTYSSSTSLEGSLARSVGSDHGVKWWTVKGSYLSFSKHKGLKRNVVNDVLPSILLFFFVLMFQVLCFFVKEVCCNIII